MSELLIGPFLGSLAAAAFSTTQSVGPHRYLLALDLAQRPNSQDRPTGFFTMFRHLCTVKEDTVRGTRYVPASLQALTAVFVTPLRLVNC